MDVTMNACISCSYYNLKDCFCEKYLRGKEIAVFLCPDCKSRPSAQPNTPTDTPTDFISRQAAIDAIHEDADWLAAQGSDWQTERMERDKSILKSLPSAQRKGKWIYLNGLDAFECSVCGRQMVRNIFDYCPWCGAEMTKGEEDE